MQALVEMVMECIEERNRDAENVAEATSLQRQATQPLKVGE